MNNINKYVSSPIEVAVGIADVVVDTINKFIVSFPCSTFCYTCIVIVTMHFKMMILWMNCILLPR